MSTYFGASMKRKEDPAMLRGDAAFIADMALPNMAHMAILRSTHAHARLRSVITSDAEKIPGVIKVITGADLTNKLMPLPCIWIPGGTASHFPSHPFGMPGAGSVLATEKVRYVGDPIAVVVAETPNQARAALRQIQVDYEPLPVVTLVEDAIKDGAPQLHSEVLNNLNAHCEYGNKEATDLALESAEVTVSLKNVNQRTINSPIEPRGAIGDYNKVTGDYILYATSQSPHNHRLLLSLLVLGIPFNKLQIVAPTMGGSFGTKGYLYADMPLALFLSKEVGRPVKWVDDRRGLMSSTVHGRDQVHYGTLAGTKDGKITALRCTGYANLGAYPSTIGPGVATAMVGRSMTSVYDIPNAFCEIYAGFTNVAPLGAQRGSGRSEATYTTERLIDLYAKKIGMDPALVRKKNLIQKDQFPYANPLGWTYDSGDYENVLSRALEIGNYENRNELKAEALERGKLLGIGMSGFVAVSGVGPSPRMSKEGMLGGTWESAVVRVHPTGEITVVTGSKVHGQGHETTYAQVAAEVLGTPLERIEVLHSDTRRGTFGQGTYGSRSFSVGGAAVHLACMKVLAKATKAVAHVFQVNEQDVTFKDGVFGVKNDPSKSKTLQEAALEIWYGWNLPQGMEPNLESTEFFDPPDFNYPFGAHVAVVEIDKDTCEIEVKRYIAVSDVGNACNPMIVDGQVHGGIAHGIGQVLFEEAVYDAQGALLTSDLTEYALPRATQLLNFELERTVTPTQHNSLGAKAAGEIGTLSPPPAIANAICDALSAFGVEHIDMPITPDKIWHLIR